MIHGLVVEIEEDFHVIGDETQRNDHNVGNALVMEVGQLFKMSGSSHGMRGDPLRLW